MTQRRFSNLHAFVHAAALALSCASVLLLSTSAGAADPGITAQKILIGQSAPLSGNNKDLGNEIRLGALAAFTQANKAGGVGGRQIELTTLDDVNDIAKAAANTDALIKQNQVFALYGYASATLGRKPLEIAAAEGVPFLFPFTGARVMRGYNKSLFNLRAGYAEEAAKIIDHFKTVGITSFGILYHEDAVGKENLEVVQKGLEAGGGKVVATAGVSRKGGDAAPKAPAMVKADPQAIIVTGLYGPSSEFIKAAKAAGYGAPIIALSFVGGTQFVNALGKDKAGVVISQVVPFPWDNKLPVVREYRKALAGVDAKAEPSFTTFEAYLAGRTIIEALKKSGKEPTRSAFMAALDASSSLDLGGFTVSFKPNDRNGSKYVDLTVVSADGKMRQ